MIKYGSVPIGDDDPGKLRKARIQEHTDKETALNRTRSSSLGNNGKPLSGWLTVRRQFLSSNDAPIVPTTINASPLDAPSTDGEDSPIVSDDASIRSGVSSTPSQAPSNSTYSARIAQTYRQVMESRQKKDAVPKEFFFAVLKGSVLFLYDDEAQSECAAAIGVDKYVATMESSEGGSFKGKDAEMFSKRNALVLRVCDQEKKGTAALTKTMGLGEKDEEAEKDVETAPWFLFSKSNSK